MDALTQYAATVYWGIVIAANVVIILFITTWMHINTMTKRQAELLKLMNALHKRMDETNQLIDDLVDERPAQQPQGYMPVYPIQPSLPQQQQFQPSYQPPVYPH